MTVGLPDVPPSPPAMNQFLQAMRQRLMAGSAGGVTSVNGETGDVTVTSDVTSVNGLTGAVTLTFPVTSVNGMTGAVVLPAAPVTSVNGKTGVVDLSYQDVAGGKVASITDYGAVCDASTNDTSAWNSAIAAINAGTITAIFVPGWSCVSGALNTITKQCSIYGTGWGSSGLIQTSAADVTMLTISLTGTFNAVLIRDIGLTTTQVNTGQALYIKQADSSGRGAIHNVHVQGWANVGQDRGFNRGIQLVNFSNGDLANVSFVGPVNFGLGYPASVLGAAWAWYITADTSNFSVNTRWHNCDVLHATLGWKGDKHLEGLSWVTCAPGFVGQPWQIKPTDTTYAPYFSWLNCQAEFFVQGLELDNASYVLVQGCEFFNDPYLAGVRTCVLISNSYMAKVDNNIAVIGAGTGSGGFISYLNVEYGYCSGNLAPAGATGAGGIGIHFTGNSHDCLSFNDNFIAVSGGGTLYVNDSSASATNNQKFP